MLHRDCRYAVKLSTIQFKLGWLGFNKVLYLQVPEVAQDENMSTIHSLLSNLSGMSLDGRAQ